MPGSSSWPTALDSFDSDHDATPNDLSGPVLDHALAAINALQSWLNAEPVNVVATSGAAQTVPDPRVKPSNLITLTANCTFTFPAAAAGKGFTLGVKQDATGSRLVTWPSSATLLWHNATTPVLATAANKLDVFTFFCLDGVKWIGSQAAANVG